MIRPSSIKNINPNSKAPKSAYCKSMQLGYYLHLPHSDLEGCKANKTGTVFSVVNHMHSMSIPMLSVNIHRSKESTS